VSYVNSPLRSLRLAAFLLVLAPATLMASEVSETYARLYERAETLQQKQEIMVAIEGLDDPDLSPFLIAALDGLLTTQRAITTNAERALSLQVTRMVVKKLGTLRSRDAAPSIFTVVTDAEDPVLRSEALAALGSIGVPSYAQRIAVILRNLNMGPGADVQGSETVAQGCITALERLRENAGFVPVFDASQGWYSRRVKEAAAAALSTMVDDPSDMLVEISRADTTFKASLLALNTARASTAPAAGKVRVAVTALEQALNREGKNLTEETLRSEIRTTASGVLRDLKADSRDAVPLLARILALDTAPDGEKIAAMEALGASGSDEAAAVLISHLKWFNDRKQSGIVSKDDRLLRSTIRVLGEMKKKQSASEFIRVKTLGYGQGVTHDAEDALKKIGWQ
jgi:hypothetical protein